MKLVACIAAAFLVPSAEAFVVPTAVASLGMPAPRRATRSSSSSVQPAMLFGGGAKPGGEKKKTAEGFNMGNMMEGLKKASEIGQKTKDLQKDLELLKMDGSSPCGLVKVTLTGQQRPISCEISDEALAEGAKVVAEKVTAAMQDAHQKSLSHMTKKLADLYGDMGLPNPLEQK